MKWNFFWPTSSLKAEIRLIRVRYNGVTVYNVQYLLHDILLNTADID